MSKLEGLARPFIMIVLVLAQIGLAAAWVLGYGGAEQAFAGLGVFTMMVITYLFKSRDDEKRM